MAQEILGNTKRISAGKRWCFTLNNYSENQIVALLSKLDPGSQFIFQEEVAPETDTPHLQGYIEWPVKKRAGEFVGIKEIHWEKAKGDRTANVLYCSKAAENDPDPKRNWRVGLPIDEPIRVIDTLRPWQQAIADLVTATPDDRTIHWYWEAAGGFGKSCLVKWLCQRYPDQCLKVCGKGSDMKYAIATWKEKRGCYPTICIFDIPRQQLDYMSWTGVEEVKDGCFLSTKYECTMVIMNCPHVICFANSPPPLEKMSADRWNVVHLGKID